MSEICGYRIIKHIGSGSYGKVYKVDDRYGNVFAMKKIHVPAISRGERKSIINEISLLKLHKSKYIIKYYDSFYYKNDIYIISEYAERGDFYNYLRKLRLRNKKLSNHWICRFLLQVCIGINYLHKNKVIHRDIKASNIYLDKDFNVKIGDFGIAKPFDKVMLTNTCIGSPYYMSPELFKEQQYSEKTDIWSLGCFLYELITFNHPFEAHNLANLTYKVTSTPHPRIFCSDNNAFFNNLIDKMLNKDQYRRCSAQDIINNNLIFEYARLDRSNIEYANDIHKNNYKIPKCPKNTILWGNVIKEINNIVIETTVSSFKPSTVKPLSPIKKDNSTLNKNTYQKLPQKPYSEYFVQAPKINNNKYNNNFEGPLEKYIVKKSPVEKMRKYEDNANHKYNLPTIKVPNMEKYFKYQENSYNNKKSKLRPLSALESPSKKSYDIHQRPFSGVSDTKERYKNYISRHKLPKLHIPGSDKKKTHFFKVTTTIDYGIH